MVIFAPENWGIWLGIFVLLLLAFVPFRLRDKMAEKLARALTKKLVNHVFVPRLI